MADEPDNLILQMLRDIRSKLDDHDRRFDGVDRHFDDVNQRLEEIHETLYTVAGVAVHANVRHDTVTQKLKALEERVGRLEEKV
ncbi:hypothetical protein U0C82_10135 [Fulvimarina sp. 2208YS6-2-32]|uniref:Uncharacterized protein n=1 Tax=Fulvimarina uroteuthidis TaxID=3098149 RepID=A0ABU5I2W9_9HYPH|nr:hypothetical protein [Fulvimarina sp. 2208YS6-2-32]MDY8109497.1 hypothetical protein [Fulvimarina sp. 2208YS6-2-32]